MTELNIWERIIRPEGEMSRSTARAILRLSIPESDHIKMKELLTKAKKGTASPADELVLDEYERVGNLLSILKAKARQIVEPKVR